MDDGIPGADLREGGGAASSTYTAAHWGAYRVRTAAGRIVGIEGWEGDPAPSQIGQSFLGVVDGPLRVRRPSVRRSWLEHGPGARVGRRGAEPFVEVSWDVAIDLVATELRRVKATYGNRAMFAGSYGWASAGRFHHAQSQVHRFFNTIGGYVRSVQSYSFGAAEIILPHVIGGVTGVFSDHTTWGEIADHCQIVVAFGGLPLRNSQMQVGGVGRHETGAALRMLSERGVKIVNVSPVAADMPSDIDVQWLPLRPNTDTALMLGLAFVVIAQGLHDRSFLASHCVGFDEVERYITGRSDGVPKDEAWAAAITGVSPEVIRDLALEIGGKRTMLMTSWSLQRADHGEQPYWMTVTLAAILGQIGAPGGGFGFGYASTNGPGRAEMGFRWPSFPQGRNGVADFIPVARIADMLLHPGETFDFDGDVYRYPDVRLIYWAGGNPFHHHHDLNRLVEAWQRPDTIVVNEPYWTATARHADIVLPVTTPLERRDICFSNRDDVIVAMEAAIAPVGESRDDFEVFRALAQAMGCGEAFDEGRSADQWIARMYEQARANAKAAGVELLGFAAFRQRGVVRFERAVTAQNLLADFRADPEANRLNTPSGRIELYSATVASFGYPDCPGHAAWLEPAEWLGGATSGLGRFHLLSPQPADKLHSQYDLGAVSLKTKVGGRAPLTIGRADAAALGLSDGDVVRVSNARGACLAGAVLSDGLLPGVVQLPTGAWFDPSAAVDGPGLERHGNPNVLTSDRPSSRLSQASACNSTLVDIARFDGEPPPVGASAPPEIVGRGRSQRPR